MANNEKACCESVGLILTFKTLLYTLHLFTHAPELLSGSLVVLTDLIWHLSKDL